VIRWTVSDGGTTVFTTQRVTINVSSDTSATCCPAGYQVVTGNDWPNILTVPLSRQYCVLGKGSFDVIVTGPQADAVFGGEGNDTITNLGGGGLTVGGNGNDRVFGFSGGGDVYGGAGNDMLTDLGPGTVQGGTGGDTIVGAFGSHHIVPGPGVDWVEAGPGNDTILIYSLCEVGAGEIIDGSFGNDTLVSPVPLSELSSRGVIVLGIENVVVDPNLSYLSECSP